VGPIAGQEDNPIRNAIIRGGQILARGLVAAGRSLWKAFVGD
jgi:hypothetical protein